ncbi:MAG: hypothetical protein N2170_03435 [Bacteroidia bacterium]|nr:hypothetical protein [Bacteroidia bacterium]
MKIKYILLGAVFFLSAQPTGPETKTILHYDATRHTLVLSTPEGGIPGDKIEIVDLIGRRVLQLSISNFSPGETLPLPLPTLPEGLYYARWITESGKVRMVRRFAVYQ